jgi:HPt (histidine-containing phosphotransfer) domain-containing protein
MPGAGVPVLDEAVLAELKATTGDDPEFVRELLETYLADVPAQLDEIEQAVVANEADALVRPAHTLKSSSATLGAMRLAAVARVLEMMGRSGTLDEAAGSNLALVRNEARAATGAIQGWLAAQAGAAL